MNAASRVGTVVTQHRIIRQLSVRGSGTSDSRDPVAPLLLECKKSFLFYGHMHLMHIQFCPLQS
jgi:hypothetical protein